MLRDDTRMIRNPTVAHSSVDDEAVMLDPATSDILGLNPLASQIWAILEQPLAVGEIIDAIAEAYEVERDRCRADVLGFLGRMEELRLIRRLGDQGCGVIPGS